VAGAAVAEAELAHPATATTVMRTIKTDSLSMMALLARPSAAALSEI
jgi:hypothetical protein